MSDQVTGRKHLLPQIVLRNWQQDKLRKNSACLLFSVWWQRALNGILSSTTNSKSRRQSYALRNLVALFCPSPPIPPTKWQLQGNTVRDAMAVSYSANKQGCHTPYQPTEKQQTSGQATLCLFGIQLITFYNKPAECVQFHSSTSFFCLERMLTAPAPCNARCC